MMRPIKVIYVVGSVLLALILTVVLLGVSLAYVERRQAQQLLAVLPQIRVGATDRAAVVQMTRPFRAHRTESMDQGRYEISISFDNRGLFLLKLAPYTDFRAWVTIKDGVVVEKAAREFAAGCGCAAHVDEKKRGLTFNNALASDDSLKPNQRLNHVVYGGAWRMIIEDDNTYEEAGRHKDWAFNLSCLTRFAGCWDARVMLPNAVPTRAEP